MSWGDGNRVTTPEGRYERYVSFCGLVDVRPLCFEDWARLSDRIVTAEAIGRSPMNHAAGAD